MQTNSNEAPADDTHEALESAWRSLPTLGDYLNDTWSDLEPVIRQELQKLPPVPLVAFVGPSGAGKSTLFELLTGVDTATSDSIRPCSYVPCLAIPVDVSLDDTCSLLPGLDVLARTRVEDTQDERAPLSRILHAPSSLRGVLACDLPDIDGAVQENHERARQILRLADRLVFTCSVHTYANNVTVKVFAEVLSMLADGDVTILMTQFHAGSHDELLSKAHKTREDFVNRLLPRSQSFSPEHTDATGVPLLSRAANAKFFCSPYSPAPALNEISPLLPTASAADTFAAAFSAGNLAQSRADRKLGRLRKVHDRLSTFLTAFNRTSHSIDDDIGELEGLADSIVPLNAVEVALQPFLPLAQVLKITIEEAHKHHGNRISGFLRAATWPIRRALQAIVSIFSRSNSTQFEKVDRQLRAEAVNRLTADSRLIGNDAAALANRYAADPGSLSQLTAVFEAAPLREFDDLTTRWETDIRREASEWCQDEANGFLVGFLLYAEPLITPTITAAAASFMVWDLMVGGLGTALIILLKFIVGGTVILSGPGAAELLMGTIKSDITKRIDRLRKDWIHKYRLQLTRLLNDIVLTPYVGAAIRDRASKRDAVLHTVTEVSAANTTLLKSISRIQSQIAPSDHN